MTARDFARLLIKLMGLFVIAMTLVNLTQAISYLPAYRDQTSFAGALFHFLVPLLGSGLIGWLLFKSDRLIADKILFTDEGNDVAGSLSFEKVEEVLLSILGIYLTAYGLIGLMRTLGFVLTYNANMPLVSSDVFWSTFLIPSLAQIAVGLLVFLSSRGLVVLRHRFVEFRTNDRNIGMPD